MIMSTVRRSRLRCTFLTSATRALREPGSFRGGRAEEGRSDPEDARPEPAPGRADFAVEPDVGELVGGFLATVSFGRCAGGRRQGVRSGREAGIGRQEGTPPRRAHNEPRPVYVPRQRRPPGVQPSAPWATLAR
jgi:hypothetical protein